MEKGECLLLMRQHAEETGQEFNEEAMYEPLVGPARGKNIGTLVIMGS